MYEARTMAGVRVPSMVSSGLDRCRYMYIYIYTHRYVYV